jgi:quercetin dioxygenase-like cupin family protein
MTRQRLYKAAGWLVVLMFLASLEPATGQAPPTENQGLTVGSTATIDLGPEIGVQGRTLRLRLLTLAPGGVLALHSHKDRPAVAYIIQGTLTEHRDGGWVKEHHARESWPVGTDVTHWEENTGSEPLVAIAADVPKSGM